MLMHWLVALLLLTGAAFAQSQQPSPSGGQQSSPPQSQPQSSKQNADDERGTPNPPLVVQTIKSQEEAAKDEQDRQEKTFNDRVTIFLSGAVAIGTILQFCALIVIIRTTRSQLRAYVFAGDMTLNLTISQVTPSTIAIRYQAKNWGQTPAYQVRNAAYLKVMPWPLPKDTIIQSPVWDDPRTVTLAPGQDMFQDGTGTFDKPPVGERYYIVGLIEYFDAFHLRRRRTKFCFSTDVNIMLQGLAPGVRQVSRDDIAFNIAPQHNEAD